MSNLIGFRSLKLLVMVALLLSLLPPALAERAAAQTYKLKYITEWTDSTVLTSYDGDTTVEHDGFLDGLTVSTAPGVLPPGARLEFRVYVQREGWYPWTGGGQRLFAISQANVISAIEMRLVNAPHIQIRYRVATAPGGPGEWKQDGETAGVLTPMFANYSIRYIQAEINVLPALAALYNPQSGRALDVQGSGTADGTRLIIFDFFNTNNQRWRLQYVDHNGYYKLIDSNSNKAIDVYGVSTANGAVIHIWTPYNTDSQLWKPVKLSDGNYKFINKLSGKVLDVKNSGTTNLTPVHLWEDNGSGAQKWRLIPL
ncbi:RICIN domain-containing protein [Paenibacillus sp. GCM10027627]|uniref:RICIN domain-containing protein n=1 Tax=unclassified Paenibacillus TaxID=185978 RepID=UPI003638D477